MSYYTTEQVEKVNDQSAKLLALLRKRDQLSYDLSTCIERIYREDTALRELMDEQTT